jgi:hypothetical protein
MELRPGVLEMPLCPAEIKGVAAGAESLGLAEIGGERLFL